MSAQALRHFQPMKLAKRHSHRGVIVSNLFGEEGREGKGGREGGREGGGGRETDLLFLHIS